MTRSISIYNEKLWSIPESIEITTITTRSYISVHVTYITYIYVMQIIKNFSKKNSLKYKTQTHTLLFVGLQWLSLTYRTLHDFWYKGFIISIDSVSRSKSELVCRSVHLVLLYSTYGSQISKYFDQIWHMFWPKNKKIVLSGPHFRPLPI